MRNLRSDLARLLRAARRNSKPRSIERARLIREMRQVTALAQAAGFYRKAA